MERFSAVLESTDDGDWTIDLPGSDRVTISDPRLADFECRRLLHQRLGLDRLDVDDLDLRLVDRSGTLLHVFDLLCTGPVAADRVAALATRPPTGCRFVDFDGLPGLSCVRPGSSVLAAVAALVLRLRTEYGLDADDLGFEKLWEWAGSRQTREQMVGQLLLMATQRARLLGLQADDLTNFVRTVMS